MRLELAISAGLVSLVALFGGDFAIYVATRICIFAIAAIGLDLISGWTGRISLGHAAFMGLGAYTQVLALGADLPLPLTLAGAVLVAALFGVVLSLATLRLLGPYFAVATLAFQVIITQGLISAAPITGGHMGLSVPSHDAGRLALYGCFTLAAVVATGAQYLLKGGCGRALVALRDQPQAAQASGIDLGRTQVAVLAASAGLCGLAGALLSGLSDSIHPEQFAFMTSLELLIMVVLGGSGSVRGAVLGALLIGLLNATLGQFAELQGALLGGLLLLSVLFMPRGLIRLRPAQ